MNYKNLAIGYILTAPSPATTGLSFVLESGQGDRFLDPAASDEFYCTCFPTGVLPDPSNAEIVKVTARSSDTFTIERAQKNTTAKSIATGWVVIQGIYAEDMFGSNSFVPGEVPSGDIDGVNDEFVLANTPIAGTLMLFRDGQLMKGGGEDYSIVDDTITFVTPPQVGSVLLAYYWLAGGASANAATLGGKPAPTGDIVGTTDEQTLTNKTLTSPKINEDVALTATSTELNLLDGLEKVIFYNQCYPGGLLGFSTTSTTGVLISTTLAGEIVGRLISQIPAGKKLYIKIGIRCSITNAKNAYLYFPSGTGIVKDPFLTCAGNGSNANYMSDWIEPTSFTDGQDWQLNCKVDSGATFTGANKLTIVFAYGD